MNECLELARIALRNGDPPVGCVIVVEDEIIGRGIESGKSTKDVTNHAEILAIRDVIARGNDQLLGKSALYTTHEPCIMCSYAIRHYKIPIVVYGTSVNHIGGYTSKYNILRTDDIINWGPRPTIVRGILEDECLELSRQYNTLTEKRW